MISSAFWQMNIRKGIFIRMFDERIEKAIYILWVDMESKRAKEAKELLEQAANDGVADAYYFLGRIYAGPCFVNPIFKFEENAEISNKTPEVYIRVENKEQIPENLDGISAVIVPLENDFEKLENVKNIVEIPRGIISEHLIVKRLEVFKQKGFDTALFGNIAAVEIAKILGFKIMVDTGLNIFNSYSFKTVEDLDICGVTVSNELLLSDIKALNSPIPKGIVSYGNIPLMLFKNCPIKNGRDCKECDKNGNLTDRKGIEFPVRCRMGYSELLNSVPVWLADKKNMLSGIDFEILYFTKESGERVRQVIDAYSKGNPADCKYTRGLFFRGIL